MYKYLIILCVVTGVLSCQKKVVEFGSDTLTEDPNITYIDTMQPGLRTLQLDSFSTLNSSFFITGRHYDTLLGQFSSVAYFDVNTPSDSSGALKACTSCYFDSLVFIGRFAGGFYGDTSVPFTLNVNQLNQRLLSDSGALGYNTGVFSFNTVPLGTFSSIISPARQNSIRIKLSNELGADLFKKINAASDTISNADLFTKFIKGFCLSGNQSNNAVYYLKAVNDSAVIQLYYHKNAPEPKSYHANFSLKTSQFNGFTYNRSGTNLASVTLKKEQLISTATTGGYAYMHKNSGLYPKINFPTLYALKELHPYIKIVNAQMEIYPLQKSYGINSFYKLPQALYLYTTNDNNTPVGSITYSSSTVQQTGDLYIDYIYNENTKYTYDITSFLNTVLQEGKYSTSALLAEPYTTLADSTDQRLILNNQLKTGNSVKLKLYVLGL